MKVLFIYFQVILVSTSGASGVGSGVYQRSVSVPMMKNTNASGPSSSSNLSLPSHSTSGSLRGVPSGSTTIASTPVYSGNW